MTEIEAGLNSPESYVRTGTARYIRQNMESVESDCRNHGFDLTGKLLQMCSAFGNSSERWEYVYTALGFNDERTAELAKSVFVSETDSKFLVMSARRLSFLTDKEKYDFIAPILFAEGNRNRTRLCANLLAGNSCLDARTAVRISVISDRACTVPSFTRETAGAWISEMQGAYPESVRAQFLKLADRRVDLFLSCWDSFSVQLKKWTLDTLLKDAPHGYEILILSVLNNDTDADVIIPALGCLKNLPDTGMFQNAVGKLLLNENEKVRAQAVLYIKDAEKLKGLLSDDAQTVRANAVKGLSGEKENMQLIAGCFSDRGWMVRAAAAQAMVRLAPDSVETVKELFLKGDMDARTAAAKCLADLGMESWMESSVSSG